MNTRRPSRSGRLALVGVASASLVLAACGGGDGDGGQLFPADTDPTEQTGAPEPTAAPEPSVTEPDTTDGSDTDSIEIPDMTGLPEECERLAEALSGAFGGMGDMTSGATQFDMFGPMSQAMRDLKGDLPAEFDADLDILADAFGALDEVLAEYDYDLMQAMVDPSAMEALEALDDERLQEASDRLGEYFNEVCTIE